MDITIKALVIDDSRIMRSMVMDGLTKAKLAQFEFVEAEDGEDALAKFNPDQIHIAFVDWNMPKMSGVDFVRKVRALPADTEHIPLDRQTLSWICQTYQALGLPPVVRLPCNDPFEAC